MPSEIVVPTDFTICGLEELSSHCAVGITHVLSILDPGWPEPSAFQDYGEHARLELRFHDIIDAPSPQGELPPEPHHIGRLLAFGREMQGDRPVRLLVHCHAGISRSTAATMLLLAQAQPERAESLIMADVVAIRDLAWPNIRMIEMGDEMLGRDGRLIAAARARHRQVAAARPEVARYMIDIGRAREVEGR